MRLRFALCFAAVLSFSLLSQPAAAQLGQRPTNTVTCASEQGQRNFCAADTGGGVRVFRQMSTAECREGVSWGYTRRGIWVDRGCRAEFEIGQGWTEGQSEAGRTQVINCASENRQPNYCPADTRGGVRLLRKISDAECQEGITWGYDRRGIWVEQGCRAEFEITRGWGEGGSERITCASFNRQRQSCSADTRGGVRLLRKFSDAECRQGSSWGYDNYGIWVDRGCRAEFEVTRGWTAGETETLTCASDRGRRQFCPTDTSGGVRLVRQLSEAECREGSTWGYDRRGVWVDRGCRGEFEISRGWSSEEAIKVTCESEKNRRKVCPADTRGEVKLVRQLSETACREGATWGTESRGIWVDRGCRAEFEITVWDDRSPAGRPFPNEVRDALRACRDEVVKQIPDLPRSQVLLEDASQGGQGTFLIEWQTRGGASGFCRINRNGRIVQFRVD